ncbi:MAG: Tim44 domain-containing protein [Syntrophales bacterium]|nr:Tim44 domain-containing protein [Syntrophales bacterium]
MKEKIKRLMPFGAVLVTALFVSIYVLELDAYARAGGGRSSGSRGSHSSYSPARPAPSQSLNAPTRSMPTPVPQPAPQSGGFWRTFAGGMAGGLLGSMLFSSLGFGHGGGFGGGGGIGFMDIIILGALLYFVYWFFKRRKASKDAEATGAYYQSTGTQPAQPEAYSPAYEAPNPEVEKVKGIGYIRQMDPSFDENRFADLCMDIFFKIQGAWGNREMSSVRNILTEEMFGILQSDAEKMKQERKTNKLENIAVRSVDISEAWQENGKDFITVKFLANLLDYTVTDSGEIVSGSKTDPVKFEEYWTFVRPVGNNPWQLSGIDQVD